MVAAALDAAEVLPNGERIVGHRLDVVGLEGHPATSSHNPSWFTNIACPHPDTCRQGSDVADAAVHAWELAKYGMVLRAVEEPNEFRRAWSRRPTCLLAFKRDVHATAPA